MEPTPMEAFPYGDWDPLSLLFTNEDLDLTQRAVLGECSPEIMYDRMSSGFPADYISAVPGGSLVDRTMPGICGSSLNPTLSPNCSSLGGNSQEGSYASGLSNSFHEYYTEMPILMEERYSGDSFVPDFMGILTRECVRQNDDNNNNQDGEVPANQEASVPAANRLQPKRKCTRSKSCSGEENNADTEATQNPKKRRPRAPEDKGKKEVQPRKKKKLAGDEGQGGNTIARQEGQSSSTYNSEEDRVSDELQNAESAQNSNETSALSSDRKTTRASRGTAADPQSLYARRRREQINERLRILQSLVPNGTKVDISTMLEEAVHYVKFLQLQIKLLSSDELWMYAPIAYNGMDIGLNQKLSQLH